jgi:hypothetical protein
LLCFCSASCSCIIVGQQLQLLLQEVHPKAEWVQIFQTLQPSASIAPAISAVTPAKFKFRYLVDTQHDEDILICDLESWDFDTVPSEDLQKLTSLKSCCSVSIICG